MPKIKLCGITRPEEVAYLNETRPDWAGFIIEVPGRRRSVTVNQVRQLTRQLAEGIVPVGVFVDSPEEQIAGLLNEGVIGMAQLHGQEDEAYLKRLRQLTDRPLVQAFAVSSQEDAARAGQSSANHILLDSGQGGTGHVFNWSLLEGIKRPFILAGGLTPDNIPLAIKELRPYGLDVSSGVETAGVKDKMKMLTAVRRARNVY